MAKIDCSVTVNFLREKDRMCETYGLCSEGCPLNEHGSCDTFMSMYSEEAVSAVQKWSDEHQPKTRLDDILEKSPHIELNRVDKVPYIRPFNYGYCKDCNKCTLSAKASVATAYCWNEPLKGGATGKAVE